MAVMASVIANGGILASPHLGLAALDGSRTVTSWMRRLAPCPRPIAAILRDLMVAVVEKDRRPASRFPA